jgi:hypothetical protein
MVKESIIGRELLEKLCSRAETLLARIQASGKKASLYDVNQLHLSMCRMLAELVAGWNRLRQRHDVVRQKWSSDITDWSQAPSNHENYRRTYEGGWGRTTQRGRNPSCVSLPDRIKECQIDPLDIERINAMSAEYAAELALWRQYAKAFGKLRTTMLDNQKLLRMHNHHSRMLSVLKASKHHQKWQGTLSKYNHDTCLHGHFLNGNYVIDGLRMLKELIRNVRKKQKKNLLRVTVQLGQEVNSKYVERKPERYQYGRSKSERFGMVMHYGRTLKKYADRIDSVVGRIGFYAECQAACDERAELKYGRLCRQVAANIQPSVPTLLLSRPELYGHVSYNNVQCPVLIAQCDTVGRRDQRLQTIVLFFGKTGIAEVDRRLSGVDWLHVNRSSLEASRRSEYLDTMSDRINYVSPAERSEREMRKQAACYARKLKRIEYISMLDSQAAGNCLPGTIQFCQQFGIRVSDQWSDIKITAAELLRKWRDKDWQLNGLFLKAIDTAYNRVSSQLASVGGFY